MHNANDRCRSQRQTTYADRWSRCAAECGTVFVCHLGDTRLRCDALVAAGRDTGRTGSIVQPAWSYASQTARSSMVDIRSSQSCDGSLCDEWSQRHCAYSQQLCRHLRRGKANTGFEKPICDVRVQPKRQSNCDCHERRQCVSLRQRNGPNIDILDRWVSCIYQQTASQSSTTAHTGNVRSIAFSPDSSLVITGGDDRQINVFDVRGITSSQQNQYQNGHTQSFRSRQTTAQQVANLQGHAGWVLSLACRSDGRVFASSSSDG